jgi:glyoxylase-like metal-dependent hydrolase (beta-lactamase superfamily II)
MQVKKFTFNPFQENTYLIYDGSKQAVIIDPGFYNDAERKVFLDFIEKNELEPVKLLNTHAHIDHVFGNAFVAEHFKLPLALHALDYETLENAKKWSEAYELIYSPSPEASIELKEGQLLEFGETVIEVKHLPGHAPGHVIFLNYEHKIMIGGDVLFRGSIGRTDLPGGNHQELISQIKDKVFSLDPSFKVYSGHGPETSVGYEKSFNPFF